MSGIVVRIGAQASACLVECDLMLCATTTFSLLRQPRFPVVIAGGSENLPFHSPSWCGVVVVDVHFLDPKFFIVCAFRRAVVFCSFLALNIPSMPPV